MAGLLEKVLHKSKSRSPQELVLKTDNSMKKLSLGASDHQVEDVARNLALMKVSPRCNVPLIMHGSSTTMSMQGACLPVTSKA